MALLIHSRLYSFIHSFIRSLPSSIAPHPSAAPPGPGAFRSGYPGFLPVPVLAARVIPVPPGPVILAHPGPGVPRPGSLQFSRSRCFQSWLSHVIPMLPGPVILGHPGPGAFRWAGLDYPGASRPDYPELSPFCCFQVRVIPVYPSPEPAAWVIPVYPSPPGPVIPVYPSPPGPVIPGNPSPPTPVIPVYPCPGASGPGSPSLSRFIPVYPGPVAVIPGSSRRFPGRSVPRSPVSHRHAAQRAVNTACRHGDGVPRR